MEIAVNSDDIAQVIGKGGKNIEMISSLIGWNIKVYSDEQWEQNQHNQDVGTIRYFEFALDADENMAQYLVECGHSSIEEIAYLPNNELGLDELDDETIEQLKANAKETIADKDKLHKANAIHTLFTLGFDEDEVGTLIGNKVVTNEDVADLSTYDLQDFLPNVDMSKAKDIIMKARQLIGD